MRGGLPSRTRSLIERTRLEDREACYDLARLLHPASMEELVRLVAPDGCIEPSLFDVLADAYDCWQRP